MRDADAKTLRYVVVAALFVFDGFLASKIISLRRAETVPNPETNVSERLYAPDASPPDKAKPKAVEVVDSHITLEEALGHNSFPPAIVASMKVVTVHYYGFDNKLHEGQIVVAKDVAEEVRDIFADIEKSHFPIEKVVPIVKYQWNDQESINDDNTSGFNYRPVAGSQHMSDHAYGKAIDINPYINPLIKKGRPPIRPYNPDSPGAINGKDPVSQAFFKRGWRWGGAWSDSQDYQHFYKGEGKH